MEEERQYKDLEPLPIDKLSKPVDEGTTTIEVLSQSVLSAILPSSQADNPSSNKRIPVVIFYNGTFSPIHPGHINALVAARDYLNNHGYQVLGGYLSPCYAGYCYGKLKKDRVATRHRLNMIKLAIENHDWLMVDTNEAMQPQQWPMLLDTIDQLYYRLKQVDFLKGREFKIAWLSGIDSFGGGWTGVDYLFCITVANRGGYERNLLRAREMHNVMQEEEDMNYYLVEQPELNISSTEIRKACSQGKPIHHMHDESTAAVADYIKKWNLWRDFVDPIEEENKINCFGVEQSDETEMKEREKEAEGKEEKEKEQEKGKEDTISMALEAKEKDETLLKVPGRGDCEDGIYYGEVPSHYRDLDYNNLAGMLAANGHCIGGIKSFKKQRIGFMRGWRSVLLLVKDIEYEREEDKLSAPQSLVVKFAILHQQHSAFMLNEVRFFRHLANRISSINVPRCYFAQYNRSVKEGLVIMEDFSDHIMYSFEDNRMGYDDFLIAIDGLAEFHAEWMGHPLLRDKKFSWLDNTCLVDWTTETCLRLMDRHTGELIERITSAEIRNILQQLMKDIPVMWKKLSKSATTLIHGDVWVNNICFNKKGIPSSCFGESGFSALDWQTICKGNGLVDVGVLMITALVPEEKEKEVLTRYHSTLQKYGGNLSYSLEDCMKDWILAKRFAVFTTFSFMSQFLSSFIAPVGKEEDEEEYLFNTAGRYFAASLESVIRSSLDDEVDNL